MSFLILKMTSCNFNSKNDKLRMILMEGAHEIESESRMNDTLQ